MAPLQHSKAKRRWTLTRTRGAEEESSSEDYGQEILPTIDPEALATLPPADQEKFKEMRKKDRKNVIARWRKEGKPVPESSHSNTSASTEPFVQRPSSAPQLPELQMDVTRDTWSTAIESGSQTRAINDIETHEQSLGIGPSEVRARQHSRHGFPPRFATHHNRIPTHPTTESEESATHHNPIPVLSTSRHEDAAAHDDETAANSSLEPEQSDETNLWLRVISKDHHKRGRRRFREPLQHQTSSTAGKGPSAGHQAEQLATSASRMESTSEDLAFSNRYPGSVMTLGESSASAVMTFGPTGDTPSTGSDQHDEDREGETVVQRRMREIRTQETYLQRIDDDRDRDYARFRGLGPVPPGLALFANAPSDSERAHARAAGNVNNALGSRGEAATPGQ